MITLIPAVKELSVKPGTLATKAISFNTTAVSARLNKALAKLPIAANGTPLTLTYDNTDGEGYTLSVASDAISITAESEQGAFYAIQTLRQLFEQNNVPCLTIKDKPDFKYRGFYHDMTRGKVATVETVKKLIDIMAYYKMNVLQLYVEHVFEFEECRDINPQTSYLTGAELDELRAYCEDNFIVFEPSLATFGHMFDILDQEKYHHLRVLKDYKNSVCRWRDRMGHHTIDPRLPESIELVKSLIDQYDAHFDSKYFNICCDETFDLKNSYPKEEEGNLYVDFVKKIIAHVKSRGKSVMMWADILQQHPEHITDLPEDTIFLNWSYRANPSENSVASFQKLGRTQIVCPGTTSWSRFVERVDVEEQNIAKMADYGYQYGALGVLNTNWGDYGNPASIEMALYGLVFGAAKSWAINTQADDAFHADANTLLYKNENAMQYLIAISNAQNKVNWNDTVYSGYKHRDGREINAPIDEERLAAVQEIYRTVMPKIAAEEWTTGDFKDEMLLALEGVCVLAELAANLSGIKTERLTNTAEFLARYRAKWLEKNKESELSRIEDIFMYCDSI
ncbi:MAG: beta-N-acetylhexosaminidase [Clostridia bacterium]|nr:beta-N-acetylhexosaminidase [Clostridia bacterium]